MPNGEPVPFPYEPPGGEPMAGPMPGGISAAFTTRRALTPEELWNGLNGGVMPTPTAEPAPIGPAAAIPTGASWAATTWRLASVGGSPFVLQAGSLLGGTEAPIPAGAGTTAAARLLQVAARPGTEGGTVVGDVAISAAQINATVMGAGFDVPLFVRGDGVTAADKPWMPQNPRDLEILILIFVFLLGGGQLTGATEADRVRRFIAILDGLWQEYVALMGAGGARVPMSFWDYVRIRLFGTGGQAPAATPQPPPTVTASSSAADLMKAARALQNEFGTLLTTATRGEQVAFQRLLEDVVIDLADLSSAEAAFGDQEVPPQAAKDMQEARERIVEGLKRMRAIIDSVKGREGPK